ncbi:4702_t:CDS:2 [Gigaspora margarita]|uniref:4702_t:CDS:1 n=1 Tax=Gigaspora margarita TaxID=4874 RepID=A0ABN7UVJ5_GIGMA|nr:4702_t:CDS:2 [Gigaspora margarita]
MIENSDKNMASPIVLSNTSMLKSSGNPKFIVWGNYIKQEKQISKGHWSATCNYCNQFWYKGSPAALEEHLAKVFEVGTSKSKKRKLGNQSNQAQLLDFIESTKLIPECIKDINRALVKAFVVCRIPFHIIKNPFFIELLKTLRLAYEPPSNDIFSGHYVAQETAFANQTIIKKLNGSKNLTIACNSWSNPFNDSIWNFVVYTSDRCQYLWCLQNLSNERHTQELLAEEITNVLEKIGPKSFSAVVTDLGANIKATCYIIAEQYPNILNLRCISHAVNLISKDIYNIDVSMQSVLRTRAFFDDLNVLAFVLRPIKIAISILESRNCSLSDCFVGLVRLGAAIKRLLKNDYRSFRQQAITIFNRKFAEFDDVAYIIYGQEEPNETRLANEERLANKERLANEEYTNKEIEDTFKLLNLDATDFTNNLGELIGDTEFEFFDEGNIILENNNIENDEEDWNPKREINAMLN